MIPLRFGEPATREHFPNHANIWDLQLIHNLEKPVIDQHLVALARVNSQSTGNRERAMVDLHSPLAPYTRAGDQPDERIVQAAARGELEREAPPRAKIYAMATLLVLCIVAEAAVMVVQQLLTLDFNPFILVIAFMLAMGGFLQGRGIGQLLARRWKENTGRASMDRPWIHVGELVVGTLLILLLAVVRAATAFSPVMFLMIFGMTVLFGEAVAVFEALRVKYKDMRDTLVLEMLQAQKWHAGDAHRRHLAQNGYAETYTAALDEAQDSSRRAIPATGADPGASSAAAIPGRA